MRLQIDSSRLLHEIAAWRRKSLPQRRSELIRALASRLLDQIIRHTPVDTGRTRAAFVRSLERLGANPPANWQGPHPEAVALQEGAQAGALEQTDTDTTTCIEATNAVPYAHLLEYGARQMAPRAMIRRTLAQSTDLLRQLINLRSP